MVYWDYSPAHSVSVLRRKGFDEAIRAAGLNPAEQSVVDVTWGTCTPNVQQFKRLFGKANHPDGILAGDLMAMSLETAAINLLNSKLSYVFTADNKSAAESFKKLYDQIASGEPAAVVDKMLIGADGERRWELFTQNVGQNYITDKILNDMRTIENQFNTEIGIPNANTQKRERLITDEVNANNMETQSKVLLWLSTMRKGITKVNERYGLNIAVNYRYEAPAEAEEVIEDAE